MVGHYAREHNVYRVGGERSLGAKVSGSFEIGVI